MDLFSLSILALTRDYKESMVCQLKALSSFHFQNSLHVLNFNVKNTNIRFLALQYIFRIITL